MNRFLLKLSTRNHSYISCIIFFLLLVSCSSNRLLEAPELTEEVLLDTLTISASPITEQNKYELPPYRPSQKRIFNLLDTKLDLSFDIPKQTVFGKAILKVTPIVSNQSEIKFDAKNFDIHSVKLEEGQKELEYSYDKKIITLNIGTITSSDTINILIDYTAYPAKGSIRSNAAIQGNQGLYFIDPSDAVEGLPTQIWSQGETENNSRWFPTFDQPNENSTQSIRLTIPAKFKSLSNGLLQSSEVNDDGTRTDNWVMSKPHAPYLFMIAVGEFALVEEEWRGRPIQYFVDKEYEASAKIIFNHTTEMLDFYSDLLGVEYPWEKFSQIIVKQFVSGAMENTTAVIFGDFIQAHQADMLTEMENDYIVAHEMIHHWFGDLVTCESWANLTLNEGFANYGEYLWFEHKYGKDEADYSRFYELAGYFRESATRRHPLIHYRYLDKDNMFDAHSYNKGGLVLHMLRNYLGDDIFFKGLKYYLEKNAYQSVEVHDLRLALEKVSGEDLNWFFDQWYLAQGHPIVEQSLNYLDEQKTIELTLSQVQNPMDALPVFKLPLTIDIFFNNGEVQREKILLESRIQQFSFSSEIKPSFVLLNADDISLGYFSSKLSKDQNKLKLAKGIALRYRLEAMYELMGEEGIADVDVRTALADAHWSIREGILESIEFSKFEGLESLVVDLAKVDPDPRVRIAAMNALATIAHKSIPEITKEWLETSKKTDIKLAAVAALSTVDPKAAKEAIKKYKIVF